MAAGSFSFTVEQGTTLSVRLQVGSGTPGGGQEHFRLPMEWL